jgi:hypothetical protein
MRVFLITGSLLLLAVAALVVHIEFFAVSTGAFTGKLEDVVPRQLLGWQVEDLPLAETKAARENIHSVLNYDQVVQRVFVKDGVQVLVYVAYWKPGRVSLVDAGSHNPDSCWVLAGCERLDRSHAVAAAVDRRDLLPYEHGEYRTPAGVRIQAMFWHLVNGRPNRYEEQEVGWSTGFEGRIDRLRLVAKDFKERGLDQRSEQMFVRISSNKPMKELLADPDVRFLFSRLGRLGIYADEKWR